MAETPLTTTPASGAQTTTQSPQTAGNANNGGTSSSGIQPGTASDLLRSHKGTELKATPLTTVNLAPRTSTTSMQKVPEAAGRHISPVLGAFSIALFVVAIVLFWLTSRSAKSTT